MSLFDPNSELLAKVQQAQQGRQKAIAKYYDWLSDPTDYSVQPTNAAKALLYELRKKILQHIKSYESEGSSWADGVPSFEYLRRTQDESKVADFEIDSGLRAIEEQAAEVVTILDDRDFRLAFNRYSPEYQIAYLSSFDFETGEILDALDELLHRQLLREQAKVEQAEYEFRHHKIREVIYKSLSQTRRILLHRQVTEVPAARSPGDAN